MINESKLYLIVCTWSEVNVELFGSPSKLLVGLWPSAALGSTETGPAPARQPFNHDEENGV